MSTSADLEIGLHRRDSDSYAVDFRFNQPDSDTDVRLGQGTAHFDLQALAKLQPGTQEYSQALTSSLFSDPAVQTAFAQALTSAQTQNLPLRVRLLIGPSAPELQSLHWETLNNPQDNSPLASGENLLFSRYLSSLDWRPVPLRPKADMRALVVIANPSNLSEYQNLAAIDVEGELERARAALGRYSADPPPRSGCPRPVRHLEQYRRPLARWRPRYPLPGLPWRYLSGCSLPLAAGRCRQSCHHARRRPGHRPARLEQPPPAGCPGIMPERRQPNHG